MDSATERHFTLAKHDPLMKLFERLPHKGQIAIGFVIIVGAPAWLVLALVLSGPILIPGLLTAQVIWGIGRAVIRDRRAV